MEEEEEAEEPHREGQEEAGEPRAEGPPCPAYRGKERSTRSYSEFELLETCDNTDDQELKDYIDDELDWRARHGT